MHPVKHFKTITEHRRLVRKYCIRLGLIRQGLMHDLSKYSPVEFWRGAIYYQGFRSPNDAERRETGVSKAWLHHKGRNLHHYEYWIDYNSRATNEKDILIAVKMPLRYVVEMMMDRIAASKIYNKGHYTDDLPLKYFEHNMYRIPMHRETRLLLYGLLRMLAVYGEEKTFHYVKTRLLKQKDYHYSSDVNGKNIV